MSRILRLREYDRVRIGERWNPVHPSPEMPATLADRLDRMQRQLGIRAFEVGRRELIAQNHVGTITVGGRTIDILPKCDLHEEAPVRARLAEMLSVARIVRFFEADTALLGGRFPTLLDMYMDLFVRHLRTEWRRGTIRSYRKEDANRHALKGKLIFPVQIRRNLLHPERFHTRADTFTVDVTLSRLLKAATRIITRAAFLHRLRQDAQELLSEFDEVSDVTFTKQELENVHVDRRHKRFEELVALARLILSGVTGDGLGNETHFALLFDMNVVFERYIGELLKRVVCPAVGLRADLQVRGRTLLTENGKGRFGLRPDVGIYERRHLRCLIDTKWKVLNPAKPNHGVSQSDIYQAYAYGREFACEDVILLFPGTDNLPAVLHKFHHQFPSNHQIRIQSVDVSRSRRECAEELLAFLCGRSATVAVGSPR